MSIFPRGRFSSPGSFSIIPGAVASKISKIPAPPVQNIQNPSPGGSKYSKSQPRRFKISKIRAPGSPSERRAESRETAEEAGRRGGATRCLFKTSTSTTGGLGKSLIRNAGRPAKLQENRYAPVGVPPTLAIVPIGGVSILDSGHLLRRLTFGASVPAVQAPGPEGLLACVSPNIRRPRCGGQPAEKHNV